VDARERANIAASTFFISSPPPFKVGAA